MKVFLGGTWNGSLWRGKMKIYLDRAGIKYFDPIVVNWTPECLDEEIKQRELCDILLYVITPKMSGLYSIAEVVDDSNKRPGKVILVILRREGYFQFDDDQWKSLNAIAKLVSQNGAMVFNDLKSAVDNIASRKALSCLGQIIITY